jgi:hypothetical protein
MLVSLFQTKKAPSLERAAQIKEWVSRHFELPQSATVIVSELRCPEPGCPPLETVIALFHEDGRSTQRKLHKALAEVTETDVRALASSKQEAAP